MKHEITPCPECGGVGKIVYVGDRKLYPIVRCSDCGHEESCFYEAALSELSAIRIWNNRIIKRSNRMERNIKTTIAKPTRKVVFEFDVPIDWKPMGIACWTACPFSVCTNLGQVCLAQEP